MDKTASKPMPISQCHNHSHTHRELAAIKLRACQKLYEVATIYGWCEVENRLATCRQTRNQANSIQVNGNGVADGANI